MKIVFTIEYFIPYATGGSEWSTYYLAKDLVRKGHQITVVTPNYGSKKQEFIDGIKIIRFPFYYKINKNGSLPGNFFYTNPLWVAWAGILYFYYLKKEKVDLIHIQGKYSILPTMLANLFLRLPKLATIRDYQIICNYGICLNSSDKACNLRDYFTKDFRNYYKSYVQKKNIINFLANLLFALYGRFSRNLLRLSAAGLTIVALSTSQKRIFERNGFGKVEEIANSIDFPKIKSKIKKEDVIIYAGRLTPGKGVNLLINILPRLLKEFKGYKFMFIGEGFLKRDLELARESAKKIEILGQIPHHKLLSLLAKAKLAVVPSTWPEPFGRIVIEALSQITPLVVSDRGALPQIVDKRWGIVTVPAESDLLSAIKKALEKNDLLISNIHKDMKVIKKKYRDEPINKYLALYAEILR